CAAAAILDAGEQEAYQLLENVSAILYGLTYLVMFAIPLVGLTRTGGRAPIWIRCAAVSGFLTTLLFVVLSVLPLVSVESRVRFAAKVGGAVIGVNVIGAALYRWGARRAARTEVPV